MAPAAQLLADRAGDALEGPPGGGLRGAVARPRVAGRDHDPAARGRARFSAGATSARSDSRSAGLLDGGEVGDDARDAARAPRRPRVDGVDALCREQVARRAPRRGASPMPADEDRTVDERRARGIPAQRDRAGQPELGGEPACRRRC